MKNPARFAALILGLALTTSSFAACGNAAVQATSTASSAASANATAAASAEATPAATAAASTEAAAGDLNGMSLEAIIAQAKTEGDIQSIGMPDNWANWGQTWKDLTAQYALKHTDADMSSAEELALFEAEKAKPTKDIGDVGMSFGPIAVEKDLVQAYKTTSWDKIPDWAKDKDGKWIIGYYGTMSFMVNTDKVKDVPKSWADIKKGTYKVSVGDVTKANQAMSAVLAASIAFGGSESDLKPGLDFFAELAANGRLDMGEANIARLEKGDVDVVFFWDFNALGYRDQLQAANANVHYEVHVPVDGSIQSGYCTVINKYAPHPAAAALAREYILSDAGQINLARGYAKPIRSDVQLPEDVKAKLIPEAEYVKARPIQDFAAWGKTTAALPELWQNDVLSMVK